MDKKESAGRDKDKGSTGAGEGKSGQAASGLSQKMFSVIKLALGICLLAFVYSVSVSFYHALDVVEKTYRDAFWNGMFVFLAVFLFVWEPEIIYKKGQRLLEIMFSFFAPLVKVAPYLLPIYSLLLAIIYGIASVIIKKPLEGYYAAALGFTIALHLAFGARTLRGKKEDLLKANYLFGFSFVYILNVILIAGLLSIVFHNFDMLAFLQSSYTKAASIFEAVFKQVFVPRHM